MKDESKTRIDALMLLFGEEERIARYSPSRHDASGRTLLFINIVNDTGAIIGQKKSIDPEA